MFFIGSRGTACARLKTVETLPPATVSDAPCCGNAAPCYGERCSVPWKRSFPATVSVLPTLLLRRCKVNAFCQISSSPNFPLFATIHLYLPPPPTLSPCRSSVIPRQFLRIISPNQPAPFPRAPHSAPSSYRSFPAVPLLFLGNSYVLSPRTNPPHSPAPPHSAPSSYRSLPSAPPLLLGNSCVLSPRTNPHHSPAPPIPHPHPTDHCHPPLRCFSVALTYPRHHPYVLRCPFLRSFSSGSTYFLNHLYVPVR